MDAMLWELLAEGEPDDQVDVLIKLNELDTVSNGRMSIVARIGNIICCRIQRSEITKVRHAAGVISMKASRVLALDPPLRATETIESSPAAPANRRQRRPELAYTGKGSVIGVADWGFDFTHPNFINPDGSTRFLAIWDQGAEYDGANPYGFGTVFNREDINDALQSDTPFLELGYHPGRTDLMNQGMHGSHVLDIAAGNGAVGESGMAPEAELIGVHLATDRFRDLMGLGDSSRVFNALHFMDELAGERPLVINMSVGSHGDSHTGLTLIEQAIDQLVTQKNNRAIVQSCGNYFAGRTHSGGQIRQDEQISLEWWISEKDHTANELEIWYESGDRITIDLKMPDGTLVLSQAGVGKRPVKNAQGRVVGRYYHRIHEPSTDLSQIVLVLDQEIMPGCWKINLHGHKITNGRFEAWIERDVRSGPAQSRFAPYQAQSMRTTGSICNGFHSIAVGAHDLKDDQYAIGFFSSVGPTWDGRIKPDLTAPGVSILAAKSAAPFEDRSSGELTIKTGTSMAAPYVAGTVALIFEAAGRPLSITEIKKILLEACTSPPTERPSDSRRFGNGALDIERLFARFSTISTNYAASEHPKIKDMNINNTTSADIESLMEPYYEEFPELLEDNLSDFFESLPRNSYDPDGLDVRPGDVLIRRIYGFHIPYWSGVVDFVDGNKAQVSTLTGKKTVTISDDGYTLNWEYRRIRPLFNLYRDESFGGEDIAAPPIISIDTTTVPGTTIYAKIPLGNGIPSKTGIYFPVNFSWDQPCEVVIYLHGHKHNIPGPGADIEKYWNGKSFPFFGLRELVNSSDRNVVLVAPTLGDTAEYGNLVSKFDQFLDQVFAAFSMHPQFPGTAVKPSAIVLAAHSGGGNAMYKIAISNNKYAALIRECWGFDSLYGTKMKIFDLWANWANINPDKKLFVYYKSSTQENAKKLIANAKRDNLGNVCVLEGGNPSVKQKSIADPHYWIPFLHLNERLQHLSCGEKAAGQAGEEIESFYDDIYEEGDASISFTPENKQAIQQKIIEAAALEYQNWGSGSHKDDEAGMRKYLMKYWQEGVGFNKTEAKDVIDAGDPWSAAFISYVMRQAYPNFLKSTAHNRYIDWAKKNSASQAHPFYAYTIEAVAVEVGDIICNARNWNGWATFESTLEDGRESHGDIVIAVDYAAGKATVVGGNKSDSVTQVEVLLTSEGKIQQKYVVKEGKDLVSKPKGTKGAKPFYFAVIKLMPDTFVPPSTGIGEAFDYEEDSDELFYEDVPADVAKKLDLKKLNELSEAEKETVVSALDTGGNIKVNATTDALFYARHPERHGAAIKKSEKALKNEYARIKKDVISIIWHYVIQIEGFEPTVEPVPATAQDWLAFKAKAVDIAITEKKWWQSSGNQEHDVEGYKRVLGYWLNAGIKSMAEIKTTQPGQFWSAAFISYVMRMAGAGKYFAYSPGHTTYIKAAKKRTPGNPFWLFKMDELSIDQSLPSDQKIEVGDIICRARKNDGEYNDASTYDVIESQNHCDIITKIVDGTAPYLIAIGGNVNDNVDDKTIQIDPATKRVKLPSKSTILADTAGNPYDYFAIIKVRTASDALAPGTSGEAWEEDMEESADIGDLKTDAIQNWGDDATMGAKIDAIVFATHTELAGKDYNTGMTKTEQRLFKTTWKSTVKELVNGRKALVLGGFVPPLGGPDVPYGFVKTSYHYQDGTVTNGLKPQKGIGLINTGRLDKRLEQLYLQGKISISQEELDLFQRIANVESYGNIHTLNTYDKGVISMGFMQFTLHVGKIQELILLDKPAFKRFGIELDNTLKYTFDGSQVTGIKGVAAANVDQLRYGGWAERFYYAGLDADVIATQVTLAQAYFQKHLTDLKSRLHDTAMYTNFKDNFYDQDVYVKALFQESHNNSPVKSTKCVRETLESGVTTMAEFLSQYTELLRSRYHRKKDGVYQEGLVDETAIGTSIVLPARP